GTFGYDDLDQIIAIEKASFSGPVSANRLRMVQAQSRGRVHRGAQGREGGWIPDFGSPERSRPHHVDGRCNRLQEDGDWRGHGAKIHRPPCWKSQAGIPGGPSLEQGSHTSVSQTLIRRDW